MINVLAIREDALTISTQVDTWEKAARRVIEWVDGPTNLDRHFIKPIVRVFMSDGESGLEEHSISDLRKALAEGTIPKGVRK